MESNSMEKTRRWLRSFFCRKKEKKEKEKKKRRKEEKSFLLLHTTRSGPLPRTAPQEETRRWSFGKPEGGSNGFNFPDLASPYGAAKIAAATGLSPIHRILVPRTCGSNIILEEFASIRIQASFRAHLARKALRALKGLVKLQALVRGQLVRKQAASMLRCMETLLSIQARAQAWKACLAEEAHSNTKKQPATPRRCISLRESRNRHDYFHETIRSTQRAKVAEIDKQRAKIAQRSRGISSSIQRDNRASKFYCEMEPKQQHISSSQSEVTTSSATERDVYPNYMANTTSSRAKARSRSAPKQR